MALLDMKILMDVFFTPTSLSAILLVASFSCVMLFLIPLFVSLIELRHKIRNIDNKVNNFQSNQEKVSLNYCYIYLLRTIILNGFFFFCVSGRLPGTDLPLLQISVSRSFVEMIFFLFHQIVREVS